MLWYVLKLILLLPVIGGLIWGSLKLTQRPAGPLRRAARGRGP
jgi:flagellar protein FliO/FliZ